MSNRSSIAGMITETASTRLGRALTDEEKCMLIHEISQQGGMLVWEKVQTEPNLEAWLAGL